MTVKTGRRMQRAGRFTGGLLHGRLRLRLRGVCLAGGNLSLWVDGRSGQLLCRLHLDQHSVGEARDAGDCYLIGRRQARADGLEQLTILHAGRDAALDGLAVADRKRLSDADEGHDGLLGKEDHLLVHARLDRASRKTAWFEPPVAVVDVDLDLKRAVARVDVRRYASDAAVEDTFVCLDGHVDRLVDADLSDVPLGYVGAELDRVGIDHLKHRRPFAHVLSWSDEPRRDGELRPLRGRRGFTGSQHGGVGECLAGLRQLRCARAGLGQQRPSIQQGDVVAALGHLEGGLLVGVVLFRERRRPPRTSTWPARSGPLHWQALPSRERPWVQVGIELLLRKAVKPISANVAASAASRCTTLS